MGYKIHHPIKEKRKTALKIFRGGADDTMCPICLEDFEESEINNNETIRCESCFQHFHYDCIKHWCESSNEFLSTQNSVCPICRQSNICRNSNFVRRESEAARIRRGIRDNQMQTPSEISDIILSIGTEYRIRDDIGLTDLMYLDENWKFNRLNSENENERNENMTNWVSDHLDKFINDMNNSAPNPESQWDIADNREENARIFREEVQRANFNRDLPVWFIAPRPEDSLDIQHLRDLHQLKMFTYNEYNRLKRDYPVYSYLELLFSAEKRKINNERRVAKRKLIRLSLRIFLYTMILVKKDTVSRGLTVDPIDMVGDSSESGSESESESENISTQTISTQTQAESETGSQTQEDTPVPEPDNGEVAEPQEDTPVPEPDDGEVAEPQEDTLVPEPDNGEVAEPQEGEENVVENDARFDWIPVEENPVEASAVEEAPMARNEAERPRAIGWRLPRVQPPGLRVEREPDGTVLFRWRLPRVQPQEEETPGDLEDRILASRRATVAAQLRENAANRRFAESQRQIADANRRFAESQRQIADLERRRQQIAENIPQTETPAESTETLVDIVGGAGEDAAPAPKKRGRPPKSPTAAEDRKKLKEMCAKAGLPYNSKEPIERIKKRLTAPRGAAYGGFINSLHELLTNPKYSNIISWKNDNDGNFLIILKDNLLVAKELCPKANSEEGKKKTRYLSRSVQAMKDQFRSYDFNRISNRGENELVFSNPKVKSIDDILTLRGEQGRVNRDGRRRTRRKARLAPTRTLDEQGEPTNRPPRRAASMWPRRYPGESSSEEESADMAAMAVPRHVLLEHDEQGDLHSVGEESADMDNNEAANVLASITNINDENTEDLDRRTSYLQNLNTNNEHSLKIALLIESLKNHVIDENEKNQIKQKQNELWQGLKEIPMEDEQRRGVLYKYMFEYLKRTIPQAKLNEGAKIAQSNFESIKRAKIHNRPTEPLTESEQKQADEEMNAAISRGQMLAQDEDTNMEDVQSAPTPKRMQVGVDWVLDEKEESSASQSGGVIYVDDENDKMRFECPLSLDIMEDPVIAEDGYSYEKEEIESWIKLSEDKGNPITSPITGDNMGKTLIPNTVLKDIIENSVFDRQRDVESLSQIEDENKNKGIVIQYKDTRFGFIHTFDGIDNLFFHSSQLDNQIIVGDIVSFVIKEYKGKPTATNIKLIEPAWNRKTGVIVKYNNDKQYGFIEADINGMPHIFVHISEINQLVSVGDKVSFIIGKNMAGKAVAKKVKIINDKIDDEIGVEEEKKEDSEIPQLEQRLLMELIFERDRIMRERQKVNSMIKSRK